ncbi:DUF2946 family protein [Rhizorhabdus argentea]|uniref:DUF2946 family protein n=1 Tax=Rhizorhabdus argentea TaxID=1387174 RepID=UPI0030EDCA35
MTGVRDVLHRHAMIAMSIMVLVLAVRSLIPAGYMTSASPAGLTVELCSGVSGKTVTIALPGQAGHQEHGKAQADSPCAFASLGHAMISAADPVLLASAIAFIIALGVLPDRSPPLARSGHLRPPLRGPPLVA